MEQNVKISFDWNLILECNYRCPYCWFDGQWEKLKSKSPPSINKLIKYWDNIYKRYGSVHIDILGGEPFLYPDFIELVKELSNIHTLAIQSNLFQDIDTFVKKIDCSNVKLAGSFHPIFAEFDTFVKKAVILKEHGFSDEVAYVAYPPQIRQIGYYKEKFARERLSLFVRTFWGRYKGVDYPAGYTEEERKNIEPYIGSRSGEKFQIAPKKVKGLLCHAGHKHAVIDVDGRVNRCGGADPHGVIGNFFDERFKLLDGPRPCDSEYCPCNEWSFLLTEKVDGAKIKEGDMITVTPEQKVDSVLKDKVSITWDIHHKCNYHCPHCWFEGQWAEQEKDNLYLPPMKWSEIWEKMYDKYGKIKIIICGGEPFLYPSFIDIIENISRRHSICIITNGSCDWDEFIQRIEPHDVYLSLSFYSYKVEFKEFHEKVKKLIENGFFVNITYIAYPIQFFDLEKVKFYRNEFKNLGCKCFDINSYWGKYKDLIYPDAYTEEEKKFMIEYSDDPGRITLSAKIESSKGRLCWAGGKYALIDFKGEVVRCGSSGVVIGNIRDNNFELLEKPAPCPADFCKCSEYKPVEESLNTLSQTV